MIEFREDYNLEGYYVWEIEIVGLKRDGTTSRKLANKSVSWIDTWLNYKECRDYPIANFYVAEAYK